MADTIDLSKVKRNVAKMVSMNAPESDIDSYILSEGTSIDAIKNFKGDFKDTTMQNQNILGRILNVPGATSRAAIQSNPALAVGGPLAGLLALSGIGGHTAQQAASRGAMNPDSVPKFQNQAIDASQKMNDAGTNVIAGMLPSAVGLAADVVTDPTSILASIIGKAPGIKELGNTIANSKLGKVTSDILNKQRQWPAIQNIFKYENNLQQATKAKDALDTIRETLGKAKGDAVNTLRDVPAVLDFSGNKSQRVTDVIKNPLYGVEFTDEGGVKNTIGNLDKVKTAVGDLIHGNQRVWEEAPGVEQRAIKMFYGKISDSMRQAAIDAGHPELGKTLDAYSSFMDKYHLANKTVVDAAGNAMGNKLRDTFKLGAEPAYSNAWKNLISENKSFPESKKLQSIMNSMKNREMVKNLLKAAVLEESVNPRSLTRKALHI